MTNDKIEDMVADGGVVYKATVPDKKQILMRVYDLYEAGKKQDEVAYYRIRTEMLEIVYELQRTTLTTYGNERYEEGVKAERVRVLIETKDKLRLSKEQYDTLITILSTPNK